ncbi:MAG TPA: hypothetical protein VNO32_11350 [Candidatus Acidoferrum sp.]|nr:hypothetical protein [Candidatus Acidoferrum sp.]
MAHPEPQRAPVLAPPRVYWLGLGRKGAPQCMQAGVGVLRDFFQTLVICVSSSQGVSGAARSGQAREQIVATRFSQPVFEYLFSRTDDESSICAPARFKPRLIVSPSGRRSILFYSAAPPYGTITVNSPGVTNVITPPHMHISVEVLSSVGMSANITVGAPGTHGATVAGMHGIGVSTPIAAAVAAATIGLAGDMHIPNGMIFTRGMLSMMLASGTSLVKTMFVGRTTSELGAMPKLHIMVAPIQTCIGM